VFSLWRKLLVDEKQTQAHLNLIEQLLNCSNEVEIQQQIINNQELLNQDLVQTMLEVAEDLRKQNDLDKANLLMNIAGMLMGLRGNTFFHEKIIQDYRTLIQDLLNCPSGEESEILQKNSGLVDQGLIQTMILISKGLDDIGENDSANFLKILSQTLNENLQKGEADYFYSQGRQYFEGSDFKKALECWQKALAIYREIGNKKGEAYCLNELGIASFKLEQIQTAIEYYQESLNIKQETGDKENKVSCLDNLGAAYSSLYQYELAIFYYQQSLEIKQEVGDKQGKAKSLIYLGNTYKSLGEPKKAKEFYRQASEIASEINDREIEARSFISLGNVCDYLGQYRIAIQYYKTSLKIIEKINKRKIDPSIFNGLGNAYSSLGQTEVAIECYQRALEIARNIGDKENEASALSNLGNAYISYEKFCEGEVINYHQQSLEIARNK